jgi:transcriptional regulator with XRE-family HTH domain
MFGMDHSSSPLGALGQAISNRRRQLGLSQQGLSDLADLHRTYIADIERGARNVSLKNIARVAAALGLRISELFWEAENKTGDSGRALRLPFPQGEGRFSVDVAFDASGFLRVRTEGVIDEFAWPSLLEAASTAAQRYECKRFFADHRSSGLRLNTMDVWNIPRDLERHGITGHRAALLFARVEENEQFLEMALAIQGVAAKVFTDARQAIMWLGANKP